MSTTENKIPNGVMLNAYPDSIGTKLSDTIALLKRSEFQDVFSLFYALPTFFNSDLDRGFSIIDYDLNQELVSEDDLKALDELDIMLKFDIVLNHLSVGSPQFQDMLTHGDASKYKDFFIHWNSFWEGNGTENDQGIIVPDKEHLNKLFMRKPGLPILNVLFPDGTERPYWNTFYQQVTVKPIAIEDLRALKEISESDKEHVVSLVNEAIAKGEKLEDIRFRESVLPHTNTLLSIINKKRTYLGQMDVNAKSDLVWDFYDETLKKVSAFGCKILRLDAFAYLHKEVGKTNFFNKPGTWQHLERIRKIAETYDLVLLPEIHSEYGLGLHDEVASKGYQIYDFFFPGLVIHTLETANATALIHWANEVVRKGYKTVNMLGCHDGIPVLDLKGVEKNGTYHKGLLADSEIEHIIETILDRGGRVKNIYDPEGNKISYYQVNATFYSALGEDDDKLLMARALQIFMPGIPQVWYLDIFAGKNDYAAVDAAGAGGHKEINRTTLSQRDIEEGLQRDVVLRQLEILRLRNTHDAFNGKLSITATNNDYLEISRRNGNAVALLKADLKAMTFEITAS